MGSGKCSPETCKEKRGPALPSGFCPHCPSLNSQELPDSQSSVSSPLEPGFLQEAFRSWERCICVSEVEQCRLAPPGRGHAATAGQRLAGDWEWGRGATPELSEPQKGVSPLHPGALLGDLPHTVELNCLPLGGQTDGTF